MSNNEILIQLGTPLREIEKAIILEQLKRCRYNRTKTARILEIGLRTLQRKLKEYQMTLELGLNSMSG